MCVKTVTTNMDLPVLGDRYSRLVFSRSSTVYVKHTNNAEDEEGVCFMLKFKNLPKVASCCDSLLLF